MSRSSRVSKYALATSAIVVAATAVAPIGAGAASSDEHTVVVSGLNNPRQLSLVGQDELLIAEAGKGGSTKISSPQGDQYVGGTGSISAVFLPRWAHGTKPNRVVTGLMSGAGQDGSFAVGSDGVSSRDTHGPIYIQETFAPPDVLPAPFGTWQDGRLLSARPYHAHKTVVADISGYEQKHDPDHKGFDSDPYAVLALPGGELVADAAGNDVLWVREGHIHVFHVFPNVRTGACATQHDPGPEFPGCNFVPTSLATDRDGHVYVGGLGSETPGEGRVVELSANGRHVLHTWTGFTSVSGVAVAHDGVLYVSQLEQTEQHPANPMITGVLTRIDRHGHRTNIDVPFPAGLAVDRHDNVFVAAWSVATENGLAGPGTSGQVWRFHF